ncbi:MAG TPA: aminotransferase class I/II-fold pyridoxal phosphate-dependent enzyme [Thermoanaerobaculia bacterium]|nr:aminotransferase class I/II-fold pyridoxal phosphate-dependent enzyme [Thermoanaerobaculia bacterium]
MSPDHSPADFVEERASKPLQAPEASPGGELVLEDLRAELAASAGLSADEVAPDLPILSLGLDSLRMAELQALLERSYGFELELDEHLDALTPRALAGRIAGWLEQRGPGRAAKARDARPSSPGVPLDPLQQARDFTLARELRAKDLLPYYVELARNDGDICSHRGRDAIMLGSGNYLGLTTDRRVRKAVAAAALVEGSSLTGSRLFNGTTTLHRAVEEKLAAFLGRGDALIFTTGYQANLGMLSALMGAGSVLFADESCHASIFDGARVAGCQVIAFRHNDPSDLDRRLSRRPSRPTLVIVDGVYSMHGDLSPIEEVREVCDRHEVRLALDDAHGIGTLGRSGKGSEEHVGRIGLADILSGSLSKSLASVGGYVAGDPDVIDWIRFRGRSIVFTAAIPPTALAAASAALDILQAEPWRLTRLRDNASYWRGGLKRLGFEVATSASAIVPVLIGDDTKCMAAARSLLERGVFVNCAVHPAVPQQGALLRTTVMATHSREQLDAGLAAFAEVGAELGLLRARSSRSQTAQGGANP